MAYDSILADRIREFLVDAEPVEEKEMMGGLAFMVKGKMCVGVIGGDMMARIDPDVYESALQRPGCRPMDFTGKPMKGWVFISPEGLNKKAEMQYWTELALDFNTRAKSSAKRKPKP
jgi:TfoX/Sxy family transcriptional regulator of competence genes